jgi:uncharacterized Zn finger protein
MWYEFRPYVSAAQRRANAAREIAKRLKRGEQVSPVAIEGRKIARTFWGQAWCNNLESYSDFSNRLPRGRSYVRNGSVVHLEIKPGKVSALVSGSELYSVDIDLLAAAKGDWNNIKSRCAGQIGSLIELLQGKLSKAVMDVVTSREGGLFPKPREIAMECSCPDWAGMCKHIAAVLYGVGARLDQQPELLFVLRGVDHLELIEEAIPSVQQAASTSDNKKTLDQSEISDVFGIELAPPEPALVGSPSPGKKPTVKIARPKSKKPGKQSVATASSKLPSLTKPTVQKRRNKTASRRPPAK